MQSPSRADPKRPGHVGQAKETVYAPDFRAPAACARRLRRRQRFGQRPGPLEYNQQRIQDAARATARTAKEVGSGVGNVAASAGRAVKEEVGDIDVDVDVTRNRSERAPAGDPAANQAEAR
ncbi:MAG TPA: hypothetical protein VF645_02925 [Allosphingosinicella sp.]|jgi:hypothetical protein